MALNESCKACFSNQAEPLGSGESCPGLIETKSASSGTETYFIQVCPREASLGRVASFHERGTNGGVIVVHQETAPTDEEYLQIAREHDL